jgi:hypothetical protein
MSQGYLKPKTKTAKMMREKRNGQFRNAPPFNEGLGGFTNASKLPGEPSKNMALERGGPNAKSGKPI